MRCYKKNQVKHRYRLSKIIAALLAGLFFTCFTYASYAEDVYLRRAELKLEDESYILNAEFELFLNTALEEALNRGVPLYFTIDFEFAQPRWYWFPKKLISQSQTLRLSYHALTQQYRLASGALHQNFTNLNDALYVLSRARDWNVLEKKQIQPNTVYQAGLRLRLDTTRLPKPFQVSALTSDEWQLSSGWKHWPVNFDKEKSSVFNAPPETP